jgi:uncharacterized delta-60 repeat protein
MLAGRHIAGFLTCIVMLLSLVAMPGTAPARSSDLDTTFGEGGRVATPVDEVAPNWSGSGPGPTLRPNSYGVDLAPAPDGTLVVAHGNLLLRYLPDGQLDSKFGEAGKLAISTVEGLPFGLADIAVDNEGKILVFGTVVDPSISRFISSYAPREVSPSFVTVLRLDSTGALDPTFGKGDGVFREGLELSPTRGVPADIPLVEAESAEIDSKGRAVIAVGKVGFPPSIRSTPGWVGDALVRLTPSGTLDPTFGGGDGIVEGILRGGRGTGLFFSGFCISTLDEPIIAVGEFTFEEEAGEEEGRSWLSRLHADGTLNRAFGRDGVLQGHGGSGPLACTRSHILMLQGPSTFSPTREDPSLWKVVRRSADDGHVNRSFGGRASVKLRGKYSLLTSIAVDRRGRVVLAGVLELPTRRKQGRSTHLTVIRLLPSGRLDESFGHDGWTKTTFGRNASIGTSDAAIDASGRPVVVGSARASWLQPSGVVLARYLVSH